MSTNITKLFESINQKAEKAGYSRGETISSLRWYGRHSDFFRKSKLQDRELLYDKDRWRQPTSNVLGNMYMFKYDPMHKDKLPYWDEIPLVIPILEMSRRPRRILGLNLHYLPPIERAELFYALLKFKKTIGVEDFSEEENLYTEDTKLILTYNILKTYKKARSYKGCIRRYNISHIGSKLIYIHPSEWHSAIFLPTRRWHGKVKQTDIWKDSSEKY